MFSSSVRRVAFTAPQTPLTPSLTSSAPRAVATHSLSYRCHQRRLSSSKPSSPADGSKGVAEGEAVPTHTQARPASEKKSSRTGKRKAKESASNYAAKDGDKAFQSLPSVPSTQHIAPQRMPEEFFIIFMDLMMYYRNLRLCLLLPPPPHFSHEQLPKDGYRRCFCCHIHPSNKVKHEVVRSDLYLIKHTSQP
jgi:hypothetical protein